jgi:hypothetical protein
LKLEIGEEERRREGRIELLIAEVLDEELRFGGPPKSQL